MLENSVGVRTPTPRSRQDSGVWRCVTGIKPPTRPVTVIKLP